MIKKKYLIPLAALCIMTPGTGKAFDLFMAEFEEKKAQEAPSAPARRPAPVPGPAPRPAPAPAPMRPEPETIAEQAREIFEKIKKAENIADIERLENEAGLIIAQEQNEDTQTELTEQLTLATSSQRDLVQKKIEEDKQYNTELETQARDSIQTIQKEKSLERLEQLQQNISRSIQDITDPELKNSLTQETNKAITQRTQELKKIVTETVNLLEKILANITDSIPNFTLAKNHADLANIVDNKTRVLGKEIEKLLTTLSEIDEDAHVHWKKQKKYVDDHIQTAFLEHTLILDKTMQRTPPTKPQQKPRAPRPTQEREKEAREHRTPVGIDQYISQLINFGRRGDLLLRAEASATTLDSINTLKTLIERVLAQQEKATIGISTPETYNATKKQLEDVKNDLATRAKIITQLQQPALPAPAKIEITQDQDKILSGHIRDLAKSADKGNKLLTEKPTRQTLTNINNLIEDIKKQKSERAETSNPSAPELEAEYKLMLSIINKIESDLTLYATIIKNTGTRFTFWNKTEKKVIQFQQKQSVRPEKETQKPSPAQIQQQLTLLFAQYQKELFELGKEGEALLAEQASNDTSIKILDFISVIEDTEKRHEKALAQFNAYPLTLRKQYYTTKNLLLNVTTDLKDRAGLLNQLEEYLNPKKK